MTPWCGQEHHVGKEVDGVEADGVEDARPTLTPAPEAMRRTVALGASQKPLEGPRLYLGRPAEKGLWGTETAAVRPGDTGSWVGVRSWGGGSDLGHI